MCRERQRQRTETTSWYLTEFQFPFAICSWQVVWGWYLTHPSSKFSLMAPVSDILNSALSNHRSLNKCKNVKARKGGREEGRK
jgi:hypothetical protein